MSKSVPAIRGVKARGVVVPLARPLKNAFGVFDSGPLVLIDVETDQGVTGHAYIFAYAKMTIKPLVHLIEEIGRELIGKPVAPYDLMAAMDAKFRLLGWQGLVGMAVSGLDMAYWDALGQVAGKPVVELLGGSPKPVKAYDSYGVVDPKADERALRRSLEQGFCGIKIKGGDGDAANDERVVKGVRTLLGPDIALMIDFNQSLDPAEASRRIARLEPYDLHWIEEPVPQENLSDTQSARDSPTPIRPARTGGSRAALRSDRSRRQRLHHARPDEVRRRHRLAAGRSPSARRQHSDVEPSVRGGQRPHARGNANRALARIPRLCERDPRPPGGDRRWHGDGARTGSRVLVRQPAKP
jgi:L-alanine-DL-glutamate epimerase-like enolase superfamily enzyme